MSNTMKDLSTEAAKEGNIKMNDQLADEAGERDQYNETSKKRSAGKCYCKQIACCCWVFTKHPDPKCKFRVSMLCPVGVECDHGRDVCSICDPCTCDPATVAQYQALIRGQRAQNVYSKDAANFHGDSACQA